MKFKERFATREDIVGRLLENGANTAKDIQELSKAANQSETIFKDWQENGGYLNYVLVSPKGTLYFGKSKNLPKRIYNYKVGRLYEEMGNNLDSYKIIILKNNETDKEALLNEESFIAKFDSSNITRGTNVHARSITHRVTKAPKVLSHVTKYKGAYSFVGKIYTQDGSEYKRFRSTKAAIELLGDEKAVRKALKTAKIISK